MIAIMGPTGAGKTTLALSLARENDGEIVSADSRQIYVGMDIGTDKVQTENGKRQKNEPTIAGGIPHYLLDILTPDLQYSAAEFRDDARNVIADMHRRGKLPIIVGGTGFYVRVLVGDRTLPDVPPDPPFRAWAAGRPVAVLARELRSLAPDLYARVDSLKNRRRVTRALEIARGQDRKEASSLSPPAWNILKLALLPQLKLLRKRIAERVDTQLRRGFIEEVRSLVVKYGENAPSLQAVGYRHVLPYLRSERTGEETKQAIIRAHWGYARRQLTWLRREPGLVRVHSAVQAARAIADLLNPSRVNEKERC